MNYNEFYEKLQKDYRKYLPEGFENYTMVLDTITKNNGVKFDTVKFVDSKNTTSIIPTVYPKGYFENCEDLTVDEIIQRIVEVGCMVNDSINLDFDNIKDNIVFQLVNAEKNEELLKDVPYRMFNNLAIIYRWVVSQDEEGIKSSIISNQLAEIKMNNISENELFDLAYKNTKRLLPPTVLPIENFMSGILRKTEMSDEQIEIIVEGMRNVPEDEKMYIISNNRKINGATSIVYLKDTLGKIADKIDSDLYVIPSSVHEVIAVSDKHFSELNLKEMVKEVNITEVADTEILSDSVYFYDRSQAELILM